MTWPRTTYLAGESVASVTMDDGKVNVMSLAMQAEIHRALDRAQSDGLVVLLSGRPGVFSAGFDLATIRGGGPPAANMVHGGFELAERILAFPQPVVMACTGHAIAMGLFLLLSGDYRIGVDGLYRLTANEVAIGLTMPRAAVEILRQRLTPAAFDRAVTVAAPFSPQGAVQAGILDELASPTEFGARASALAASGATLDRRAHAASKLRARRPTLEAMRAAIEADLAEIQATALST
jgi:enoyl-CoA hydratase